MPNVVPFRLSPYKARLHQNASHEGRKREKRNERKRKAYVSDIMKLVSG